MATMPQLNITFKTAGMTAITRGERGTLLLVLRQGASVSGNPVTVLSASDIPAAATATNKKYIQMALLGNETAPRKVVCYFIGTEDDLTDVFDWAQRNKADWFAMPTVETDELVTTVRTWIVAQKQLHNYIMAVLPNCAADSEYIVNYTTASVTTPDGTFTAEQFTPRIAGIICGTPLTHSVTYASIPEATDCTRLTDAEMDTAVAAGQLFCFFDGQKVKLSRGVNSKTTLTAEAGEPFTKIKHMDTLCLIRSDIRQKAQDSFIGKYANSYANRCLLMAALEAYFDAMAADGIISGTTMQFNIAKITTALRAAGIDCTEWNEQQIREYDFGTHVYFSAGLRLLDAIEDIDLDLTI